QGPERPNAPASSPGRAGANHNAENKLSVLRRSLIHTNMKVSNQLAALLSLGALLPVAASAKTSEQAYLESCRKGPDIPVPVVVVAPHVGSEEAGASAQVEFLVGADGKASEISVKSSSDSLL